MRLSRLARLAAIYGLDDFVSARELGALANSDGPVSDALQRDVGLLLARELLVAGVFEIGEVDQSGFRPWRANLDENLADVACAVLDDVDGGWGMGLYFRLTGLGREVGVSAKSTVDPALWRWD